MAHLEILVRVCETLELAHSHRVVHRDIKPDNVRVGRFGEVYLMDWGIALRLDDAAEPELLGTPAYMAPEMACAGVIDERTDVYLLGATLHEILTGRRRHDETNLITALASALRSAPVAYDASVPASLAALANAATARDPAARPKAARAFREEVDTFLRQRALSGVADAALSRLAELEGLLAAGAPPDLGTAYRLANEARFGFTQCLREHPGHAPSRAGLRRCVVAQVELELRQDHDESAEALLAGLDPPDPSLARRVADAKGRAAERRREGERLRRCAAAARGERQGDQGEEEPEEPARERRAAERHRRGAYISHLAPMYASISWKERCCWRLWPGAVTYSPVKFWLYRNVALIPK